MYHTSFFMIFQAGHNVDTHVHDFADFAWFCMILHDHFHYLYELLTYHAKYLTIDWSIRFPKKGLCFGQKSTQNVHCAPHVDCIWSTRAVTTLSRAPDEDVLLPTATYNNRCQEHSRSRDKLSSHISFLPESNQASTGNFTEKITDYTSQFFTLKWN